MSNRLAHLSKKGGATLLLALACSLGCGCLTGEGTDDDRAAVEEPGVDDVAEPVDGADADAVDGIILGDELAALEADYQQAQLGDLQPDELGVDGGSEEDERGSNPDPTPWEAGQEGNPDPTPWQGDGAENPDPTPWITDDEDEDDDELGANNAFATDSSGGTGWGHGND